MGKPRFSGVAVLRHGIKTVPIPFHQFSGEPKTVTEAGKALQSNKCLNQVGIDFQVFALRCQNRRRTVEDWTPIGRFDLVGSFVFSFVNLRSAVLASFRALRIA